MERKRPCKGPGEKHFQQRNSRGEDLRRRRNQYNKRTQRRSMWLEEELSKAEYRR
jgi:hypothetical protein